MKHFYVSTLNGISGICKYSRDFYELLLKERNYIFIDSSARVSDILSAISSQDHVHLEIGIFQKKEINLLFLMLKANYKYVSITLHDAPLLKYPYYEFSNPLLNNLSKLCEIYANSLGAAIPYIKKIKAIYVLTHKGVEAVKKKYGIDNVYYIPHIIDPAETEKGSGLNSDFLYFGFIGKNKGIEYSLSLHQEMLNIYPQINFYVIGKPLGNQHIFYNSIIKKYKKNVHYLGYLEGEKLDDIFRRASFALIPFKDYKFFWPVSGSILYSLKKGKIVLTNKVNSTEELIKEGKTGFFLSGDLKKDSKNISWLFNNNALMESVQQEVYNYLQLKHSPQVVAKYFEN